MATINRLAVSVTALASLCSAALAATATVPPQPPKATLWLSHLSAAPTLGAACYGNTPCKACKNCRYCGHCAKGGGNCGVCRNSHSSTKREAASLDAPAPGRAVRPLVAKPKPPKAWRDPAHVLTPVPIPATFDPDETPEQTRRVPTTAESTPSAEDTHRELVGNAYSSLSKVDVIVAVDRDGEKAGPDETDLRILVSNRLKENGLTVVGPDDDDRHDGYIAVGVDVMDTEYAWIYTARIRLLRPAVLSNRKLVLGTVDEKGKFGFCGKALDLNKTVRTAVTDVLDKFTERWKFANK